MKVSVIILNYNGKDFIQDCIDSILQSSYRNIEIIILDNASTDNGFRLLTKKNGKNPKVKLYRSQSQLYFTGGCNFAAGKATGELLFFLNNDTTINKNCIKHLVGFIGNDNKILVQPKILFSTNPNIIDNVGGYYDMIGIGHAKGRGQPDYDQYASDRQVDYVNGTAFIITKTLFDRLGGFAKYYRYYYEDVDLCLRAKKYGGKCWYHSAAVVYHKNSLTFINNISIFTRKYYYLRNRLLTAFRHKNPLSLLFIIPLWIFIYTANFLPTVNWLRFLELRRVAGKKTSFSLLDLGAGNGSFVNLCRKQGINALGIDKNNATTQYVIKSSIENLHLKRTFSVITMYHVLEHCKNPELTLRKINTLLHDTGILVIEAPLIGNFTEKLLGKNYFAYHDKTHKHFFTKTKLEKLLKKSGFKIIKSGFTIYEFPATVLTTSIQQGFIKAIAGLILFIPFKLLSLFGYNDEIIRLYCKKS